MATFTLFTKFKLRQHNGNAIDFDTDDLRIALRIGERPRCRVV